MSDAEFVPERKSGPPHLKRNLTEGPIAKTLILFSLPLLGTNVLQSLNFSANQFWVAHILGVTAITAIGNANVVSMLAQGAIFGATSRRDCSKALASASLCPKPRRSTL